MDVMYYLVAVLAFLSVAALLEALFAFWRANHGPGARRIRLRLQAVAAGGTGAASPLVKPRLLSRVASFHEILRTLPFAQGAEHLLRQTGTRLLLDQFLGLSLGAAILGYLLGLALHLPGSLAPVPAALGACAPALWLLKVRDGHLERIDHQLPDSLDLMSRALRAGHSFTSALQMVATESPEPIAQEFRIAFDEVSFGTSVPDAMTQLAERVPSNDLRYMVVAVITQRETGGNLAELLGNTAAMIRSRHKLLGTVKVLATEGKFSAWILVILPFALAGVLQAVNPDFMKVLWTDPTGIRLVAGALIAMAIGVLWMWRIVKIHI
jgi:tight adherence protein B